MKRRGMRKRIRRRVMRNEKGTPSVTEGRQKDPFCHRGATLSPYFSFWISSSRRHGRDRRR